MFFFNNLNQIKKNGQPFAGHIYLAYSKTRFWKNIMIYNFLWNKVIESGMKSKYIYFWVYMTKEQLIANLYSGLIDEKVWVSMVAIRG